MTEQLKAFWKRLVSYRKEKWDINDYPLRYRRQADIPAQYNVGELKIWAVQVINWWMMTGVGNTKQEAYEHLRTNFKEYLKYNQAPRPGTVVPITLSDTSQIDKLEDVAADFFRNVLDINYYECFISDESSLGDFGMDDKETLQRINNIYKLDLEDLGDGNLVRLLKLIKRDA